MNTRFEELSSEQKKLFSMNGAIQITRWQTHLNDSTTNTFYDKKTVDELINKCDKRQTNYYGETDKFLYEALKKYAINEKKVAIIGSAKPWYEAVCLSHKGLPYTIEYNKLTTDHELLNLMTVEEHSKNKTKFDFAFSISSFEHDGLGRYGDPLNPDGDIDAMKNVKENILNKNGILFLAVPVGVDKIVWNAHRIYGRKRLPKLLDGFKLIDSFGFIQSDLDNDTGNNVEKQPIFVLENI